MSKRSEVKQEIREFSTENNLDPSYVKIMSKQLGYGTVGRLTKKSKDYRQAVYEDILTTYQIGEINRKENLRYSWRHAGLRPTGNCVASSTLKKVGAIATVGMLLAAGSLALLDLADDGEMNGSFYEKDSDINSGIHDVSGKTIIDQVGNGTYVSKQIDSSTPNNGEPFTFKQGFSFAEETIGILDPDATLVAIGSSEGPKSSVLYENYSEDTTKGDGRCLAWNYVYLSNDTDYNGTNSWFVTVKKDGIVRSFDIYVEYSEPLENLGMFDSDDIIERAIREIDDEENITQILKHEDTSTSYILENKNNTLLWSLKILGNNKEYHHEIFL